MSRRRTVREVAWSRDPETGRATVEVRVDGEPVALPPAAELAKRLGLAVDEAAREEVLAILADAVAQYMTDTAPRGRECQGELERIARLARELDELLARHPYLDRPMSAVWLPIPEGAAGSPSYVRWIVGRKPGGGAPTPREMLTRVAWRAEAAARAAAPRKEPGRPRQEWRRVLASGLVRWWRGIGGTGRGAHWDEAARSYRGPLLELAAELCRLARLPAEPAALAKVILEASQDT